MSDPILVLAFLLIIFAPCLLAYLAGAFEDTADSDVIYHDKWRESRRMDGRSAPLQGMLPEVALAEDFEIRSFPKGLSQRRIVIRDEHTGPKLTMPQLRAAAAELVRIGGHMVVHRLALIAAAMVAAGKSVVAAAREALEAAHHMYTWLAWGESLTRESSVNGAWDEGPPKFGPARATGGWHRGAALAA